MRKYVYRVGNMSLKVAIIVMEPFVIHKQITRDGKTEDVLYGLLYDIWDKIKTINKLHVNEIILDGNKLSYDALCDEIGKGKYDIAIGDVSVVSSRVEKVFFTRPIYLNEMNILYKPIESKFKMFTTLFFTTFLPPLILLIVIGISLGALLWSVDKKRGHTRAILSTVASMFGEMGYVSERSNLTKSGIAVVFLILLTSYYYTIFLQAITVDKVIKESSKSELSKENIRGNTLLSLKGSALGTRMSQYGVKTKQVDLGVNDLVEYYLKHTELYRGVLFDYHIALNQEKRYSELSISLDHYGFDEIAFPVNKSNISLLKIMNSTIVKLQKQGFVMSKCKTYMGESSSYLCSL